VNGKFYYVAAKGVKEASFMRSPLCWLGGKSHLREKIISMIPKHKSYVEAFAGAAWVLFGKPLEASRLEVLNDIDGELINFYRVLQRKQGRFLKGFEWLLASREIFQELRKVYPSCLSPEERAVRFFYLVKASINGKRDCFLSRAGRRPALNLERLEETVRAVHERLRSVIIENVDVEKLFHIYDRPGTFFYLDPPYWGLRYYRLNFTTEQHERLAELLRRATGKWILSYNDVPEIRRLYKGFEIEVVRLRYSAQTFTEGKSKAGNELLIKNF
jgi:DNA adenine methylase